MASRILARRATTTSKTLFQVLNYFPARALPAADGARSLHSVASSGDLGGSPPSDLRSMGSRSFPTPYLSRSGVPVSRGRLIGQHAGISKIRSYCFFSASDPYNSSSARMQSFPRWYSVKAQVRTMAEQINNVSSQPDRPTGKDSMGTPHSLSSRPVVSFSPLEASISSKEQRPSGLRSESLKIKRIELSQKITYALIPILLLVSKTKLSTSVLILSVFWQIYGFFKEIFLDYVHQEVTRKWVLIYFKLLLLIVAKDLLLDFDMH